MFKRIINRVHGNESGVTGLETAIILIAFVVVASVFAYTVLSAGLFSAQEADETVRSGIRTTQSTMKLRGAIHAFGSPAVEPTFVQRISFTVSNVLGEGQAIDLTPTHDGTDGQLGTPVGDRVPPLRSVTIISFHDDDIVIHEAAWTVEIVGGFEAEDYDFLLEAGEKATITVWLQDSEEEGRRVHEELKANDDFSLQVMPAEGATLEIWEERIPPHLSKIMRLQ